MIYTDGIHLIGSTLDELHSFSQKIGLKKAWFQNHPHHPHYDLMGSKQKQAIKAGAKKVSSKELITILKTKT